MRFSFLKNLIMICELKRVLKKNAPLIISAQNRYVQSLSAISEKPSAGNISWASKVLVGEEHECMSKDNKVTVHTWTPQEFRTMLERNGLRVEKMIGKALTMPLRIKQEIYSKRKFSEDLFNEILKFEYTLCENPDSFALAGHLQAVAFKI